MRRLHIAVFAIALVLPASQVHSAASAKPKAPESASSAHMDNVQVELNHPYGFHTAPIMDKIKATPDQRQKISQIVESYRGKIQPLRDEYKQKRQEFINQMTSGGSAESIMAKQVELSHLSSEISAKYTLMRLEIRHLLSPEQILAFEEYARQHGWNH